MKKERKKTLLYFTVSVKKKMFLYSVVDGELQNNSWIPVRGIFVTVLHELISLVFTGQCSSVYLLSFVCHLRPKFDLVRQE